MYVKIVLSPKLSIRYSGFGFVDILNIWEGGGVQFINTFVHFGGWHIQPSKVQSGQVCLCQ